MGNESLTIISNNVPRPTIEAYELSSEEREEFDYVDFDAIERGEDSRQFVRYKGELIDLDDMEPVQDERLFPKWDLIRSDTFFSGILVKWNDYIEFDEVIMGRYYS